MTITVAAPAKLNLDLRIVGRRPDGYHDLRTLFQSIDLRDTLRLSTRPGSLTVRSRSRSIPRDQANLVWRAAEALWNGLGRSGVPNGVAVTISKTIPMAGGLGGGSSDAAAALRGLCVLWEVRPSNRWLHELAAHVGSDVPYFLTGGLARGVGRGVHLRSLADLERHWVVLAVPRFGVSSAAAYRWFDCAPATPANSSLRSDWRIQLDGLRNDLEAPVAARHGQVRWMVGRLRASGAIHAAMTGSGSTVYGLYRRRAAAVAARRAVRAPGWRTLLSRTIGRREFARVTAANSV